MKKLLKYLGALIIIFLAIATFLGNIHKGVFRLTRSFEDLLLEANFRPNKVLNRFEYFVFNRVTLEDNTVIWKFTLDTTYFYPEYISFLPESLNGGILPEGDRSMELDLDTLLSHKLIKQNHKCNLLFYQLFTVSNNPNPFFEGIMENKYSQSWQYQSPFSDRQIEIRMTYDEMKSTADFCKNNPRAALKLFMSEYIARQNRLLTLANDNADVTMHMVDEGENITLCYICDKTYSANGNMPISNLRDQRLEIKNALYDDINNLPIFYGTLSICKKTKKDFLVRFYDWNKTDSLELKIYEI